jgi:hypothetical protein
MFSQAGNQAELTAPLGHAHTYFGSGLKQCVLAIEPREHEEPVLCRPQKPNFSFSQFSRSDQEETNRTEPMYEEGE